MSGTQLDFRMTEALAAGAAAVVVIVAILVLAWGRYLSHKETMRLYERSGDVTPFLEERARWRARGGRLYGVRVLIVGLVLLLLGYDWTGHNDAAGPVLLVGLLLMAIGITTMVAHARWSQEEADRAHPPTQEELERREGRRLRGGVMVGVVVLGQGMVLLILALVYNVLSHAGGYREELERAVRLNLLEQAVYLTAAGLVAVVGCAVTLGYAVAGRRWRRKQTGVTPATQRAGK